jgi:dipeptidase D
MLAVRETDLEKVKITLNKTIEEVVNELKITDPGLTVSFEPTETPSKVADLDDSRHIIRAIYGCPNGVIRMVPDMPDVVETSTNLAIIEWEGGKAKALSLQRSSVDSAKDDLCNMIKSVFELAGAKVEHSGDYPGWKPNIKSPVLKTMKQVYNQKYGKEPEVKVIHAGLECGIIGSKYPQLDMISFGPTIRNPHSPDEMVNIKTVSLFWDFLLETLVHAPVK